MKKYIKPATVVENVAVRTEMMAMSGLDITETTSDNTEDVFAKERDVWKDGFWN